MIKTVPTYTLDIDTGEITSSTNAEPKVYCPLAPYGVCEGKIIGISHLKGRARFIVNLVGLSKIIGEIYITEDWVFDTFEKAMNCFIRTGGDKPE